mmetsp:Transcript_13375/g.16839  ORF Transcript_13375/g.16839 Transcript_13375/m.16839 type:complete len:855 (-) Transcript_13375:34-2598(-)
MAERVFGVSVEPEDLPYEEEVQKNRYSLKAWLRYLQFKSHAGSKVRNILHERALKELPGSYKLWHQYLQERTIKTKKRCIDHPSYERTNQIFERALMTMHKMPVIWEMYCRFLIPQLLFTKTRHTFDQALRALPVSQHKRIWNLYLSWVKSTGIPEQSVCSYERAIKLDFTLAEDFLEFLLEVNKPVRAAELMVTMINRNDFVSKKGKSKHQMWLQLCKILSKHPECGRTLNVEGIMRQGLEHFVDQVGRLWTAFANYYIRQSNFEKARDVFEEALSSVMTARDFVHIWEAYTQFEDSLITAHLQAKEKQLADLNGDGLTEEEDFDFELRVARYEYLIERRALLFSSVKLRQNPNNVEEWQKRVELYDNPLSILDTYVRAVRTVDPMKATGRPHTLWVNYAKYYESNGDLDSARMIFEKATTAKFRSVAHLAALWCEYIEMELMNRNFEEARKLVRRATEPPKRKGIDTTSRKTPIQMKLHKSTRLWRLYVDIEESLGTYESTKAVYERILNLRVATPQVIINYARFLEERNYFEESFKVFERGVHLFSFPYSLDIWICYLHKFVARYADTKIERTRDLFEQAIESVPADLAKIIYITYAEVEEEYGYVRHAMSIYDRATRAVIDQDKYALYQLYISRATEFFGVTRTREIYEKALQNLPDKWIAKMSMQYADLECKLGEIDRARAIYVHCSQFSDPRSAQEFWEVWKEFEVRHGNVDTFREMLRVRRSVQAQYNTQVNFVVSQLNDSGPSELGKRSRSDADAMEILENQFPATHVAGTVSQSPETMEQTEVINEEEIDIGDDDEDSVEEAADVIEQKPVPKAVFGSVMPEEYESQKANKPVGALARLRARQQN